ncbi:uncharacterized protein K444DRAFT_525330, partial [Hyaloscypha bicolor E]
FLVIKKVTRTYRLINTTIKINLVILRNTNLFLFTNKILKKFTRYIYISLINFFSGYN